MNEFNKIIEFAISKEQEAVDFYHDLQNVVKHDSTKEILKDFELMEHGHIEILKSFKTEEVMDLHHNPNIKNLKLSDPMVEPLPSTSLTFQEVMIMAMKREDGAAELYQTLSNEAENANVKKLFQQLADEEMKHKFQLESMYEKEVYYEY
jgi:rubrerythrin